MEIYESYLNRLSKITDGWNVSRKKLNNGFDFLTLKINEGAEKSLCFSAGIHGEEPAGPEAVLKFVEQVKVPKDVFVMIFPCVNPYGFNRGSRRNAFRQDINRRFCDKLLSNEAKTVYGLLKSNPVDLFVSLHEWSGKDGFYMYASDKIKKKELLEIPKLASKWFTVFNNRKVNGEDVDGGIIWHPDEGYQDARSKCTLENRVFKDKIHYLCLETPSKAELEDRSDCQFGIMKEIVKHII